MESNINRLCALCEGIHFDSTVGPERPLIRHHSGLEALTISAQDGCHLCTLMLSALRWRATPIADEPQHGEVTVGLTWSFSLFQILLDVTCGNWKTELLLLDFSATAMFRQRDATTWEGRHEYSQSAEISTDPSSDRIFSQIHLWLHNCSTTHQRCQSVEAGTTLLPTRVIDVGPPDGTQNPRLKITSAMKGDYVVLSHCWGRATMVTTTLSELDNRVECISMDLLPKNFQDAIKITRKLHLRYIWLDSLCIIQDSRKDWEQESAQMGKYYANAWLTISADAALDSHGGILNNRNILEITSCKHPRLLKTDEASEEGRMIVPNIGSFMQNVQEGPLSKRGWILQERVLSRRILHWCRNELYWECTELQASERRPEGVERSRWKGYHITELLRTSQPSHSIIVATPIQTSPGKESQSPDLPQPTQSARAAYKLRPQLLGDSYSFWYELLEDFCKRNLTVGTDKLPAISGLASSFKNLFLSDPGPSHSYVAGLWATDLPIGLAWRGSLQTTTRVNEDGVVNKTGLVNRTHRVPFYRAPSFSWASVDGAIEHPYLDSIKQSRASVPGFEPDVLDVQVIPAGVDLFGQVLGGRVKLRGYTKAFNDLPKHSLVYLDESREIGSLSARDQIQGPWTCLCLGVVTHNQGDPTTYAYCLLLEATGPEHEEYRRVGLVETVNSKWFRGCARRDILII